MPASPRTAAGRALLARVNDVVEGDLPCSTFLHEVRVMLAAIEAEAGLVTDVAYFKERGWDRLAEAAAQAAPLDETALWEALNSCEDVHVNGPKEHVLPHVADEYIRHARLAPAQPVSEPGWTGIANGTHEPAVDDFGNQYVARLAPAQARPADAALLRKAALIALDARAQFSDQMPVDMWAALEPLRHALAQQPTAAEDV